jgi:hypothetical protein
VKIKVYQVNQDMDRNFALFRNYDSVMKSPGHIDPAIYKTVFDGNVDAQDLEDVFAVLNFNHPVGYNGHSLSVSDVVEIEGRGCFFCDSLGFKEVPDFDTSKVQPLIGHRMLAIEPHKEPYEIIIPDGLDPLQQAVGGLIECTYPFDDNVYVVGNEEAKLIGLEGNRRINGGIYAGTILIAGDDGEGGTMDLTDEQVRKYTEMFRTPENITPQEVQNDIWCAVIGFN